MRMKTERAQKKKKSHAHLPHFRGREDQLHLGERLKDSLSKKNKKKPKTPPLRQKHRPKRGPRTLNKKGKAQMSEAGGLTNPAQEKKKKKGDFVPLKKKVEEKSKSSQKGRPWQTARTKTLRPSIEGGSAPERGKEAR